MAIVIASGGSDSHVLRASFQGAVQVVKGQEVRLAGVKVGKVGSVREDDGQALLDLDISDDRVWPLHRGTIARLRFGTTVSYAARYVELLPGPKTAPALASGGVLTTSDTITPVEFDQIFNIYNGDTRRNLQRLIGNGAAALDDRADDLSGALQRTPGAFGELASLMREVGADRSALGVLAGQGARTSRALARVDGPLQRFVDSAATTFDELAARATAQRATLDRLPGTLHTTSDTLGRLDRSQSNLHALVADLRPGARGLRRLAGPAQRTLTTLNDVAPLATRTLRTGRRAAPSIRALLREGVGFMPQLRAAMDRLAPAIACMRPYGPEIAGALGTWAGFAKNYDGLDHYARTLVQAEPYPAGTNLSSQRVSTLVPGVQYAFPRPPGLNVGQAWLQPQCGAGAQALDAARDPEAPAGGGR